MKKIMFLTMLITLFSILPEVNAQISRNGYMFKKVLKLNTTTNYGKKLTFEISMEEHLKKNGTCLIETSAIFEEIPVIKCVSKEHYNLDFWTLVFYGNRCDVLAQKDNNEVLMEYISDLDFDCPSGYSLDGLVFSDGNLEDKIVVVQ